jgi:hypothetical protein
MMKFYQALNLLMTEQRGLQSLAFKAIKESRETILSRDTLEVKVHPGSEADIRGVERQKSTRIRKYGSGEWDPRN